MYHGPSFVVFAVPELRIQCACFVESCSLLLLLLSHSLRLFVSLRLGTCFFLALSPGFVLTHFLSGFVSLSDIIGPR